MCFGFVKDIEKSALKGALKRAAIRYLAMPSINFDCLLPLLVTVTYCLYDSSLKLLHGIHAVSFRAKAVTIDSELL